MVTQEPFKQKFAYVPDPKGSPVYPDGHDPTGFLTPDEAKSMRKKKKLLIGPDGVVESEAKRKKRKKLQAEGIETDREIPPNRRGAVVDGRVVPRAPYPDDVEHGGGDDRYRPDGTPKPRSEVSPFEIPGVSRPRNPGDSGADFQEDERESMREINKEKYRREKEEIEGVPAPRNPGDSGADFQEDERESMREINEEKYRREEEEIEGLLPRNSPVPPGVPAPTGGGSTTIYESPLPPDGAPRESGTPEMNSGLFGHYSW